MAIADSLYDLVFQSFMDKAMLSPMVVLYGMRAMGVGCQRVMTFYIAPTMSRWSHMMHTNAYPRSEFGAPGAGTGNGERHPMYCNTVVMTMVTCGAQ